MRKLVLLLILGLLAGGCATKRRCTLKYPNVAVKDSIYIETVKEKPVYIPGDSIFIEAPVIDCPDQSLIKFENSKLKQEISIIKGKLIASTLIKPDTIKVPVIETKTVVKKIKVPEVIKVIPGIYRVSFWLWVGVILAGVGYVALRVFVFRR